MKRVMGLIVLVVLMIASAGLLRAQRPIEKPEAGISAQELSRLDISKMQEQVAKTTAGTKDGAYTPFDIVVQFLQLRPGQAEQLKELVQARQKTVEPLAQAIALREQRLNQLLEAGGPALAIGQLAIEIHNLQIQVLQAQRDFLSQFENLLDPDQRQRLEAVRLAAKLQPVLPAFQQLQLF